VSAARRGFAAALTLLFSVLMPDAARAQSLAPQPPGALVFDIRGTTLGVPQTSDFYPDLPGDTIIPARGFGLEAGVHVYPWAGGSRSVGLGADLFWTRASATPTINSSTADGTVTGIALPDVAVAMVVVSPQVSINFGTSRGWSYLTTGGGVARVRSTAARDSVSRAVGDLNAGGGARWFISDRLGVGFDLRLHWVGGSTLLAASAGFSLK
jgi:hypothetical protein